MNINKTYFYIKTDNLKYYSFPIDKEGEKVNFLDKKSVNLPYKINENIKLDNIEELIFTIQLFSNEDIEKVIKYMDKFLAFKNELIIREDLYLFSIKSDIGNNYFLTYKNFLSKNSATEFCHKSNILNKCLIINIQN